MPKSRRIRQVSLFHTELSPINEKALKKLIRYYYKGSKDIQIEFTESTGDWWGDYYYISQYKLHVIRVNMTMCSIWKKSSQLDPEELVAYRDMAKLSDKDITYLIIGTILHELMHAIQCDRNPISYQKCSSIESHPRIDNKSLSYFYSPLETEAESWSLKHIVNAIEKYENFIND